MKRTVTNFLDYRFIFVKKKLQNKTTNMCFPKGEAKVSFRSQFMSWSINEQANVKHPKLKRSRWFRSVFVYMKTWQNSFLHFSFYAIRWNEKSWKTFSFLSFFRKENRRECLAMIIWKSKRQWSNGSFRFLIGHNSITLFG